MPTKRSCKRTSTSVESISPSELSFHNDFFYHFIHHHTLAPAERLQNIQQCPTCVTFSVTLCVRSMSLQGAMMSISPVGRAMRGSGLKSTKLRVIWGILEMARYRMRSESDVEFRMLDLLFTAPGTQTVSKLYFETFLIMRRIMIIRKLTRLEILMGLI